ncbi:MAG: radical SAM protein [Deltaproteobacteria bacterium]|nr:MAG: radical SAM protein [Deltaproteobacteria bacterium]
MFSLETIQELKDGIRKGTPTRGPVDVQILPVDYCNAKCVFCPAISIPQEIKKKQAPALIVKKNKLDLELFYRLIDELKEMGEVKRVHFTGGEPLLHPELTSMVTYLKRKMSCCEAAVVTNGIDLVNSVEDLAAAGVDRFSISINGASAESLRRLGMGGNNTFDKIISGLNKLKEIRSRTDRPLLGLTAVLTRHNYSEVEKLANLALDFKVNSLTFLPLVLFKFGEHKSNEAHALNQEEFHKFSENLNNMQKVAKERGIFIGLSSLWDERGCIDSEEFYQEIPCYSGYIYLFVCPDGKILPCCNCLTALGDLNKQSLNDIWQSEGYTKFREKTLNIANSGMLNGCLCQECGYIFENEKYHTLLKSN